MVPQSFPRKIARKGLIFLFFLLGGTSVASAGIPAANAGPDLAGQLNQPLALQGRGYETEGKKILSYRWQQLSGPAAILRQAGQATAEVILAQAQTHVFTLTVSNGQSTSATDTVAIRFLAVPNKHPVTVATQTVIQGRPGEKISLDGRASTDPEGDALIFEWRQLGGPKVQLRDSQKPLCFFLAEKEGTYLFKLTVSDQKLSAAPVFVKVVIGSFEPLPEPLPEDSPEFPADGGSFDSSAGSRQIIVYPGCLCPGDERISSLSWLFPFVLVFLLRRKRER